MMVKRICQNRNTQPVFPVFEKCVLCHHLFVADIFITHCLAGIASSLGNQPTASHFTSSQSYSGNQTGPLRSNGGWGKKSQKQLKNMTLVCVCVNHGFTEVLFWVLPQSSLQLPWKNQWILGGSSDATGQYTPLFSLVFQNQYLSH